MTDGFGRTRLRIGEMCVDAMPYGGRLGIVVKVNPVADAHQVLWCTGELSTIWYHAWEIRLDPDDSQNIPEKSEEFPIDGK